MAALERHLEHTWRKWLLRTRGTVPPRGHGPVLWGLAAHCAQGMQTALERLQRETARNMALCGKPNLAAIDRGLVKIHRR